MASVRVVHDTVRSAVVTVPDLRRPYKVPFTCVSCGVAHYVKTYHLVLDDQGATIVSDGVRRGLKRCDSAALAQLQFESEVTNPPRQTLGLIVKQPGGSNGQSAVR